MSNRTNMELKLFDLTTVVPAFNVSMSNRTNMELKRQSSFGTHYL